jgi:hypothetical protein
MWGRVTPKGIALLGGGKIAKAYGSQLKNDTYIHGHEKTKFTAGNSQQWVFRVYYSTPVVLCVSDGSSPIAKYTAGGSGDYTFKTSVNRIDVFLKKKRIFSHVIAPHLTGILFYPSVCFRQGITNSVQILEYSYVDPGDLFTTPVTVPNVITTAPFNARAITTAPVLINDDDCILLVKTPVTHIDLPPLKYNRQLIIVRLFPLVAGETFLDTYLTINALEDSLIQNRKSVSLKPDYILNILGIHGINKWVIL